MELLGYALSYFPDLYRVGSILFWGFWEEVLFGGGLVFQIIGIITGVGSATAVGQLLHTYSDEAGSNVSDYS
jgi:hypothetical protein